MILNIKEYNKKYNMDYDLKDIDDEDNEILIQEGFVKWEDEDSDMWCGPYKGNFAKFSIIDYSQTKDILSLKKTMNNFIKYANFSVYNLPYRLKENLNKYQMSSQEKLKFMEEMTKKEMEEYVEKINKEIEFEMKNIRAYPTKEYPVCIYMCGNDDFSKSLCVENEQIALSILNDIENNPIEETLNKYNFRFTN